MNAIAWVLSGLLMAQSGGGTDSPASADLPAATWTPTSDFGALGLYSQADPAGETASPPHMEAGQQAAAAEDGGFPPVETEPARLLEPPAEASPTDVSQPPSIDVGGEPPLADGALPMEDAPQRGQPYPEQGASLPLEEPARLDLDPPALVAEALRLPEDSPISGNPLTLAETLSAVQGSAARLQVARDYWRLTQAVGHYRARHDESRLLDSLDEAQAELLVLRAAKVSAHAALERAGLMVIDGQFELAVAAMLPAGAPPPLPADLPHVGPYRTYFGELFAQRTAPPQARLADRVLPIGRKVVDLRADALNAAAAALEAAMDAYRSGQCDLATVLHYAAERGRQQRELVDAVCAYNADIAEYAVAVAPQAETSELVAMMIMTRRDASGAAGQAPGTRDSDVLRAALDQPAGAQPPSQPLAGRRPTLAPPKESAKPEASSEPSAAEPRELPPPVGEEEAAPLQPAAGEGPAEEAAPERPDMVPITQEPPQPFPWIARRPLSGSGMPLPAADGLYPALVDKEPAVQAKQLAAVLHWVRLLPEPMGEPATLRECLRSLPAAERQAVIEKYWIAGRRAAEYQALVAQQDALEELAPFVERREAPGGPSGYADRLQSAGSAAEAELLEAHHRFLESQLELTQAAGRPTDSAWLLPTTQPHCGPYRLKLDAQPEEVAQSWPVRHAAAMIPGLAENVARSANAVVQADATRAAITAAYQSGDRSLDEVLEAIRGQTRQTLVFLEIVETYNRAIARYALAVLPQSVGVDPLVGTLVLE